MIYNSNVSRIQDNGGCFKETVGYTFTDEGTLHHQLHRNHIAGAKMTTYN